MMIPTLESRHNPDHEICIPYPFTGQPVSEVRVCGSAIVPGEPWMKARIDGYFKYHDRPQPGASIRIPDYQFDPSLFQPEKWSSV
jgi:hypothetical protein